jgi:hypothetical protein
MKCLLTSTLILACGLAQAQTIWRCGPDGRSYGDSPCAQGRAIDVSDARDDEAVAAAHAVAAMERRLAAQLRAERQQREREQRAQGSGLIAMTAPEPAPLKPIKAKPPKRVKQSGAGASRATARASRRKPD